MLSCLPALAGYMTSIHVKKVFFNGFDHTNNVLDAQVGAFLSCCIFLFGLKCVKPPDESNTESEKVL